MSSPPLESTLLKYDAWPRLEARAITAYRGEPASQHRHLASTNSHYSFWLIERGQVRLRSKLGERIVRASEWILWPPFLTKRHDFAAGAVILSLGIEASWAGEFPWMHLDEPIQARRTPRDGFLMTARRIIEIASEGESALALGQRAMPVERVLRLQTAVMEFIAELTPVVLRRGARVLLSNARDPRLHRLVAELRSQPSIHPLPYARWRREGSLSRVQIDRLFREEFGDTPRGLRDRFLLAAIKRDLHSGTSSVKEAAARHGFSDSSHLCRWFRRYAGVSPHQSRFQGLE